MAKAASIANQVVVLEAPVRHHYASVPPDPLHPEWRCPCCATEAHVSSTSIVTADGMQVRDWIHERAREAVDGATLRITVETIAPTAEEPNHG